MPNTDHGDGSDRRRDHQHLEGSALARRVEAEVVALHDFLGEWFRGAVANDDDVYQRGFARRFDPGFVLISPDGSVNPFAKVLQMIQVRHGASPELVIEIRDVIVRRDFGEHLLVTYEEWQRGATASATPGNARISTALLREDRSAPGGLAWLHLHECWLPAPEVG